MSDWTGQDAIEDAKDAGSWFRDRKRPNIIERLKKLIENIKDNGDEEKKIPPEKESLDEAINDAAEYLRNKKGDIENVSDAELEGALDYVLSGKPVTYQDSDTFLGGEAAPEKEEPSTISDTFFSEGPPSNSVRDQLTKIRPPKSNEDNPDPQQIAAADQGLFKDPQGNVVDKDMTPMKWDGKQWVPDTEKEPKYGSFFQ